MHREGKAVEQNYEESFLHFKSSAEEKKSDAQICLGEMYRDGLGVAQNYEEAIKYFKLSADQGNEWGQFCLGEMYRDGKGIEKNQEEADKYFKLVTGQNLFFRLNTFNYFVRKAEDGDSDAIFSLGVMYRGGNGVEQNKDKAKEYFKQGQDKGNELAKKALYDLEHPVKSFFNKFNPFKK